MNEIMNLMGQYIGPGGQLEQLYDYIAAVAASTNLAPSTAAVVQFTGANQAEATTTQQQLTQQTISGFQIANRQRGGTLFATSPTLFRAGEGGPERIDVTPLSQSTGAPRGGFGGGGGAGSVDIALDVGMEEGLVGNIVDQSLDAAADVVVSMTRKSRQKLRR
jgi:hypothetical protein